MKRALLILAIAAIAGVAYVYLGGGIGSVGAATGGAEDESVGGSSTATVPPVASPRAPQPDAARGVSALGRLEPQHGLLQVAGPSDLVVVVKTLNVEEGDRVKAGEIIATLDTGEVFAAKIARIEAELERSIVYSPIDGQVLDVHTRPGERVGVEGIVELAKTHRMYAIAEVYEADVGRVRRGQRATITSPALPEPLSGKVEWISLKVAKQDALGTDPAARKDARVVEVRVRLDDSAAAAGLTNLQVEVLIEPSEESD